MSGTPVRTSGRPLHGEPILERAFRLLGAFAEAGESLPLHALATRAGLPKSTTSRIANQLMGVGALERLDNGDFVVGLQLLEIASLAPRGHGLRAAALPFMEDLHRVTHQHILLAVRDGHEAVLVERLSARDAAAVKYRVGGRLPLTETGIGVALLAHAPEQVRDEALASATNAGHLRRLMAAIRREGVCAMTGPNPLRTGPTTMSTVAAPILNRRGDSLGALSLVAPDEGRTQVAARVALRTASLAISRTAGL
ncbi:IclR family transcriptional regulator [Amycolatopsis rubida]|uniref:IclR family transcriptional regulator n=1 Tax=Amycolatopsis rubida TaxID=112413 RepID=A0ABX0BLN6_9PSEU|nr:MULTISPECIES: IclR family transcriptional regulator [Amycolatopsis]MYW90750.1 helix-turn-helix domain-containing protein [Amycolatopsis rubida]NEC55733.1 IclR family transcriptional regulator [Amycolatopsis rubida]OAP19929.1 HTH-type transcriptional regulator KipR [Amycolatopsis sp. M39]